MAKQQLEFSLITPEARVYQGATDFVALPAHDGEIGILPTRAPLVARLGSGRLKIRTGEVEQSWFVDAGFVQVVDNRVVVLTQTATRTSDIDVAAAEADLERARHMPTGDDEALRRRVRVEASARARLRLRP